VVSSQQVFKLVANGPGLPVEGVCPIMQLTAGICREQCKQCCVHAVNLVQRAGGVSRSLRRVSCERAKVVLEQVNKLCQIGRERRGNMLCQHPESVLQSLECMR